MIDKLPEGLYKVYELEYIEPDIPKYLIPPMFIGLGLGALVGIAANYDIGRFDLGVIVNCSFAGELMGIIPFIPQVFIERRKRLDQKKRWISDQAKEDKIIIADYQTHLDTLVGTSEISDELSERQKTALRLDAIPQLVQRKDTSSLEKILRGLSADPNLRKVDDDDRYFSRDGKTYTRGISHRKIGYKLIAEHLDVSELTPEDIVRLHPLFDPDNFDHLAEYGRNRIRDKCRKEEAYDILELFTRVCQHIRHNPYKKIVKMTEEYIVENEQEVQKVVLEDEQGVRYNFLDQGFEVAFRVIDEVEFGEKKIPRAVEILIGLDSAKVCSESESDYGEAKGFLDYLRERGQIRYSCAGTKDKMADYMDKDFVIRFV